MTEQRQHSTAKEGNMVDMAMIAHYNQSFGDKSLPSEPSNGQLEQSSGTEGEIAFQVYLLLQKELKRLLL